MPGRYTATISVPGVTQTLRGEFVVQGDPTDKFSAVDRRERQNALMTLYDLQKTLASTRARIGAATASDANRTQLTRARTEVERLTGVTNALMRALESFNSAPTADQRKQIGWASEDVSALATAASRL
jgi:hypothetical protein